MTRFPEPLQTRVPQGVSSLVAVFADQQHMTTAQYVRAAVMDRLLADGARFEQSHRERA